MGTHPKRMMAVAALAAALGLALTGCMPKVDIPKIPDVGAIQAGSAQTSAAAAECSKASGKISEQLQLLLRGVKEKDPAAIETARAELAVVAVDLHKSASDGMAAAESMSSVPMSGDQVQAALKATFKMCDAIGGFADDLVTKVSSSPHAYGELQRAAESMSKKIQDAADEMAASMPKG